MRRDAIVRTVILLSVLVLPVLRPVTASAVNCQGEVADIVGTTGDDSMQGGQNVNVAALLGGNDFFDGRGSGDKICMAEGQDGIAETDSPNVNDGPDLIELGAGCDSVYNAYRGNDGILGMEGNDAGDGCFQSQGIWAGVGNDSMNGGGGGDYLNGEGGTDSGDGGPGVDRCSLETEFVFNCENIG